MSVDFIDSNVLVYLLDDADERKRQIAADLVRRSIEGASGRISFQVVHETLNVLTRKLSPAVTAADARDFLDAVLMPLWRVMPSQALYRDALDLQERYRYGFYDSLILAAALSAGCTTVLSEDLQHGQKIQSLTIVNPFRV